MARFNGNNKANTIIGSNFDDELYGNGGNDTIYGNLGNDLLFGGSGKDKLFGGDGNDQLNGGTGNDRMDGGAGGDAFNGGDGIDTVTYASATTGVTAYIPFNTSTEGDSFVSIENLIGSAFDDFLQAGAGGRALGGAGDDHLYGSGAYGSTENGGRIRGDGGYDTLNMTYGNTQAWLQNGQGYDTISGFVEGSDQFFIKLSDFGLGNTLDTNEITNSDTITAVGSNAQFIFENDSQRLWFDANGSSAGGLTLVAYFESSSFTFGNIGTDDFQFVI